MQHIRTFENVIIAVSAYGGQFVVSAPKDMIGLLDGEHIEDNTQSIDKYPSKPGVYRCKIDYWFERGTYEGWDAPGESDWDLIPIAVEEIPLTNRSTATPRATPLNEWCLAWVSRFLINYHGRAR